MLRKLIYYHYNVANNAMRHVCVLNNQCSRESEARMPTLSVQGCIHSVSENMMFNIHKNDVLIM